MWAAAEPGWEGWPVEARLKLSRRDEAGETGLAKGGWRGEVGEGRLARARLEG